MTAQSNPVTVAFNNQVPATEAANYLGCSYSHMINLIKANKLKAQKREGRWFVESDELQRAKATRLVGGRRKTSPVKQISKPTFVSKDGDTVDVKIQIPREKFELLKIVCEASGKTLMGLINEKLDSAYDSIRSRLSEAEL